MAKSIRNERGGYTFAPSTYFSLWYTDLQKMDIKDLKKEVSKLSGVANKRMKRLEESGVRSQTYEYYSKDGFVKFGVKDKTRNQLIKEYYRAIEFLNNKTSTVSGSREVWEQRVMKVFGGVNVTQEQENRLWEVYKKFIDIYGEGSKEYADSDQIIATITEMVVDGKTPDEILDNLEREIHRKYEEFMEEASDIEKGFIDKPTFRGSAFQTEGDEFY